MAATFMGLGKFYILSHLELEGNNITVYGITRFLEGISKNQTLVKLNLNNNKFSGKYFS